MAMSLVIAALLMRVGVTLYSAGLSRARNAASSAFRCIFELWIAILSFWIIGAHLIIPPAQRENGSIIGLLATVLLVSGFCPASIAERSRLRVVLILSILLNGLLLPWTIWLSFRLATHAANVDGICWSFLPVGLLALTAAKLVGPRTDKFNRDGSTNGIPGHNMMIACGGFMLMLSALVATTFNAPANIPTAILNMLLAVSAGGLVGSAYCRLLFTRIDPLVAMSSCLAAAIACSAAIDVLSPWYALAIGAIAGAVTPWLIFTMELRVKIDDVAALGCVALIGGILGPILGTLFISPATIGPVLLHLAIIAVVAVFGTALILLLLRLMTPLRIEEDSEHEGLDLAEHDLNAYPDFQQTMIKSYHLRER